MIRAKCISRIPLDISGHKIPNKYFDELDIGTVYDVFCAETWDDDTIRIYIFSVEGRHFPSPYDLTMFNIVECVAPDNWTFTLDDLHAPSLIKRFTFPEWARDERFFEKLIDCDSKALTAMERARAAVITSVYSDN